MARRIPTSELVAIEGAVSRHPGGASFSQIVSLCPGLPRRTLQARIKKLVDDGRLVRRGERRGARYRIPGEVPGELKPSVAPETGPLVPLSKAGKEIQKLVSRPVQMREPVGYDYTFPEEYSPNHTFYLTETDRNHLQKRGRGEMPPAPAGTYARDILDRLLIDLSWNSSRLEGNTYSLPDTERLINFGREGRRKGRPRNDDDLESQGRD